MKQKNLRILHLGNIANNAYLNAKFLRQKSWKADVISHDYFDPVSTPEWEESELSFDKLKNKKNLIKRPSWFMSGSLAEIAALFCYQDNFSPLLIRKTYSLKVVNYLFQKTNERYLKISRRINPYFEYLSWREYLYFKQLIKKFKKFFPNRQDQLTIEDILPYSKDARVFRRIFASYDLVQCYGLEPVYALLARKRPYIAFEHGTLRNFPFENSPRGRLAALSYKMADLVFITNPDNIKAARELKLKRFLPIPHPIGERWHLNRKSIKPNQRKQVIFCPARHDWGEKKTDCLIKALALLDPKIMNRLEIIFVEWGQDLKKSKALIRKLGLNNLVVWKKLLTRRELAQEIEKSNIVLDQIKYFGLGGITAEALLAGRPVLNSYDKDLCRWIFPDPPPIVSVFNTEEITASLNDLIRDPRKAQEIGQKGKKWFKRNHSRKIVTEILIKAYKKLVKPKFY